MATVKENWTMPAYVGNECDGCYEISNIPWPLNEVQGDGFQAALESLGFIWIQNPNEE